MICPPRAMALGLEMLAEAFEQLVDQPGLRQRLANPDRGGIRHWVLEVEIKKAHERQAVADQVLSLLIREIVERLQHHDLELQDRIVGLATSVALALLGLRLGHALDVSAEVLPPHDLLDRFQRIAFGADRLKPALNIEKARLPHDSLARSAHGPLRSASQIRSDLARRIFRGALMTFAADDPDGQANFTALAQGLQEFGWTVGRNLRLDYRWGANDLDRFRTYAAELITLLPDVVVATAGSVVTAFQQASRTVPIVFVTTIDPVGGGWVESLARPGGNVTG